MKRDPFSSASIWIGVIAVGAAGYYFYKRWKDGQRAAAHPITIQNDATLLRPMRVDPSLVTDAKIIA